MNETKNNPQNRKTLGIVFLFYYEIELNKAPEGASG